MLYETALDRFEEWWRSERYERLLCRDRGDFLGILHAEIRAAAVVERMMAYMERHGTPEADRAAQVAKMIDAGHEEWLRCDPSLNLVLVDGLER